MQWLKLSTCEYILSCNIFWQTSRMKLKSFTCHFSSPFLEHNFSFFFSFFPSLSKKSNMDILTFSNELHGLSCSHCFELCLDLFGKTFQNFFSSNFMALITLNLHDLISMRDLFFFSPKDFCTPTHENLFFSRSWDVPWRVDTFDVWWLRMNKER